MNFLKIGSSPVVEIPLAVKFENMHLNQCYQILPGSKVVTEFDPNWSNITTLGDSDDGTSAIINEFVDIQGRIQDRQGIFTGSPADAQFMAARLEELNELKVTLSAANIDPEIKATLEEQLDAIIDYTSCSADANARRSARIEAYESACSLNPWVALAKCLGGASLDIFGSYVFKWLELNVTGSSSVAFTNFSGVTSQMDWSSTLESAGVSCVFSVIPIPSGKTAIAAMVGASGLSAAEAFSGNVLNQYNNIKSNYSTPAKALQNINWQQAVTAASGAGMITFASTALMRASGHATVQVLKSKIIKFAENNGADVLRAKLKTLGFTDIDIDSIFKKFGIFAKPISKNNSASKAIGADAQKFLKETEVSKEIMVTTGTISDAAKKFWANHEVNVTGYLRGKYGNANVGRQITIDITLTNGQKVTCIVDNLVKSGSTYKIIDAKSSINVNLSSLSSDKLIEKWCTPNQQTFYNALKNEQVQTIKPRGQNAMDFFGVNTNSDLFNISIGNSIEFFVNDVATDNYNIYNKLFSF